MYPNPILKKLGLAATDRLVILHADDIGMCQASLAAYTELWEAGCITSGAVMVPCPWFPGTANYCRQHQTADMGVHLTLTSEWEAFRWAPISTCNMTSGLIDTEGYFFRSSEEVQAKGDPLAVAVELRAQIERARSSGIALSHLDTHMNSIAHSKFVGSYVQLALQFRLPFLFPRKDEAGFRLLGMDAEIAKLAASSINFLEEQGLPLVDHAAGLDLDYPDQRLERAIDALRNLPVGITHFILHPSKDTPELRAITPDWRCRVADFETYMSDELHLAISNLGLQLIGYSALKALL